LPARASPGQFRRMITRRDAEMSAFLQSVPIFQELEGPRLETLYEFLAEKKWEVGETICSEGEPGRTMYIIREGEVVVQRKSAQGNQVSIVTLGPGECFGEMTLVELQPRSASCVVKKRAVTYSLTNPDLGSLYKADTFAYIIVMQNICRMLSRRLRKADSRIVEFLELLDGKPAASPRKAAKKPAKKPARATRPKAKNKKAR
jgi:CRP/FNR family transcriptional regulator, cyclic AMP receptor protein